jgi:3-oxoacyl-[acyl-carrier protein] reductase
MADRAGRLTGQCAIITGAAGGIGRAVSLACAAEGAAVCLADIVAPDALAAEITDAGGRALALHVDVTQAAAVRQMVVRAEAAFTSIDILVNVAGVVSFGPAATLAEAEWDRVLSVNLKGAFLCCQAVIPGMRARRRGRIVNLGSIIGKNGGNARPWIDPSEQTRSSNVAYGASKAGVHAMTSFLARELASAGITVNAVAPGPVASAMTTGLPDALKALIPLGRMGRAEDVAAAVVFLASDAAAFITGEILDVNGGMLSD